MQHLLLIPFASLCLVFGLAWAVSIIIDHDVTLPKAVARPAQAVPPPRAAAAAPPSAQIIYLRKPQTSVRSSGRIAINGG